ncbi:MAG: carbamoyltransferase HypF [Coriobacteriia bacterium]|nr:carbamoyltransferase HypF [Coriobacteriia bacterium]
MKALTLHITGIVQGVGFRPFVYNLALERGLLGWVLNASDGVYCMIEGDAFTVDGFPQAIRDLAPKMAVIEAIVAEEVEAEGFADFTIRASRVEDGAMTLVSPDIATCPECTAELFNPADRRYRYPFINCTNCGPRFTIIDDVPYDRPMTSMRDFPMCPQCADEYGDPRDRRFHAQPDACFICGPRLYLNDPSAPFDWCWTPERETSPRPHRNRDVEAARSDEIIARAASLLLDGRVLAIKGLGGFHLACDATNPAAVARLRERKRRWGKPLAIMVPSVQAARAHCEVDATEADLLAGVVRPIVLLRRQAALASAGGSGVAGVAGAVPQEGKVLEYAEGVSSAEGPLRGLSEHGTSAAPLPQAEGVTAGVAEGVAARLAEGVADGLVEVGVMLPYTPLHHLLLNAVGGRPLVMTSGNLSDEPIATDNAEALERLGSIADAFLLHDRAILSRYDDSVVRVVNGLVEPVRRSRGYAPFPLPLPFTSDTDILAAGPEQKSTFTLIKGGYAFVSQHVGDLENAETLASFEATERLYERLFRITPDVVAHDLHPEYLSTKWALDLDLPKVGVQHHHAHIVSVTAENAVSERVVGIAFDGTGYGEDGRIWGGEVLLADWADYERFAHLAYVPMPGGSGAIKRPARMAIGTLTALGLLDHPGAAPLKARLAEGEERLLSQMIERRVNCPLTSSMGRLFDTVAALIGVADDARYEGEAAILLEAAADPSAEGSYEFGFVTSDTSPLADSRAPLTLDPTPVVEALLDDIAGGIPVGVLSMRFHRAVVACIVRVGQAAAESAGTKHVALAGGVFMNRIVLGGAVRELRAAGLVPLNHVRLPVNDGAVSFGQAVIAWARRHGI